MAELNLSGLQDVLTSTFRAIGSNLKRDNLVQGPRRGGRQAGNAKPVANTINVEDVKKQLEFFNSKVQDYGFNFKVNDSSGKIVIQITNKETGEVLRTIPPASLLKLSENLDKETGLLIDSQS